MATVVASCRRDCDLKISHLHTGSPKLIRHARTHAQVLFKIFFDEPQYLGNVQHFKNSDGKVSRSPEIRSSCRTTHCLPSTSHVTTFVWSFTLATREALASIPCRTGALIPIRPLTQPSEKRARVPVRALLVLLCASTAAVEPRPLRTTLHHPHHGQQVRVRLRVGMYVHLTCLLV